MSADRDLANKIIARLKEQGLLDLAATDLSLLEKEIARIVWASELWAKAAAFDRLVSDLAGIIPIESRIKELTGLPLAEALKGFVVVSADEWSSHKGGIFT